MSKIFISYRRSDSAYATGRIYDRLCQSFGTESVFIDVDKMPMGLDFRTIIDEQVRQCDVMLAVIGAAWLSASDAGGNRRLDNPADFVRLEIESALRRDIPVIPLLLDRIDMPAPAMLPESIRDLAFRHGTPTRPDPDFNRDLDRLIKALKQHLDSHRSDELSKAVEAAVAPDRQGPIPRAGAILHTRLADGSVGPEMRVLPAGRFRMGDLWGTGGPDELPVREVRIAKAFAIGRYPVTFDEYDRFVADLDKKPPDDRGWGRGRRPVIHVSWQDAQDYARWLSEQTGERCRLPSEAEWEYAARSGGQEEQWPGTSDESALSEYAWYHANSDGRTQPVGKKKPNGLGLHDMGGNVWEWVRDRWHENYEGAPEDGWAWGEGSDGRRVLRGGSWFDTWGGLRSSHRYRKLPDYRNFNVGFRLAQDID